MTAHVQVEQAPAASSAEAEEASKLLVSAERLAFCEWCSCSAQRSTVNVWM